MTNRERQAFILRGQVLESVRENRDRFIHGPVALPYGGKVLRRPDSANRPYIGFLGRDQISDELPSLEPDVDSIARRLLTSDEASV